MGNRERILALIRTRPGLTDTQIREQTGIQPHQQVNQICRALETQGLTRRVTGPEGRIINLPVAGGSPPAGISSPLPLGAGQSVEDSRHLPTVRSTQSMLTGVVAATSGTLVVTACSKAKRRGSGPNQAQMSVLAMLPEELASKLREARSRNAQAVKLDESALMAAVDRYDGFLYEQGRSAIRQLTAQGVEVLILSGGYGVVRAEEAIGMYDCRFHPGMWPGRIVQRCLAAIARVSRTERVIGVPLRHVVLCNGVLRGSVAVSLRRDPAITRACRGRPDQGAEGTG